MAVKEQILSELAIWKTKRFRETDIPLERAVESIGTNEAQVVARAGSVKSRWVVSGTQVWTTR